MNTVQLIGRITKDPELRYSGEMAVVRFTLAVNRMKTKKSEEPGADFISCVVFGKSAENLEKYSGKGRLLGVTGRIQTGSYEKDGKKIYTTDIICDRVEFLDRAQDADQPPRENAQNRNVKPSASDYQVTVPGFESLNDDDIPF